MARIVYKFGPVHPDVPFRITLPMGAQIVHVGLQRPNEALPESIYMWVELDTDSISTIHRVFSVFGTGWAMPDGDIARPIHYIHRGTVQNANGFVWHLYEIV